jgi:hypothetical protein
MEGMLASEREDTDALRRQVHRGPIWAMLSLAIDFKTVSPSFAHVDFKTVMREEITQHVDLSERCIRVDTTETEANKVYAGPKAQTMVLTRNGFRDASRLRQQNMRVSAKTMLSTNTKKRSRLATPASSHRTCASGVTAAWKKRTLLGFEVGVFFLKSGRGSSSQQRDGFHLVMWEGACRCERQQETPPMCLPGGGGARRSAARVFLDEVGCKKKCNRGLFLARSTSFATVPKCSCSGRCWGRLFGSFVRVT